MQKKIETNQSKKRQGIKNLFVKLLKIFNKVIFLRAFVETQK